MQKIRFVSAVVLTATLASLAAGVSKPSIRVCATTPALASLVRAIGGEDVAVTALASPSGDAHAVQANARLVEALARAQLLVVNGLALEEHWLPALLERARTTAVRPGGRGYLDASRVVQAPEVPAPGAPAGNHPLGNPHYLLDPVAGLEVADAIRGVLEGLRPASRVAFMDRYEAFRARLARAMVGERLASKYPVAKLAELYAARRLEAFLEAQHERELLGGWFAARREAVTTRAVGDHDVWAYFARRFHVDLDGFLEPLPGVAPTDRHLGDLANTMRQNETRLVLSLPYFGLREARRLADRSGGRIVPMAHQVGARPGTGDYIAMIDFDLRALSPASGASRKPASR